MTARLLKVIVQPVYAVEDGEDLTEVPVAAMTLTPSQWRALDPDVWAKEGAAQIEAQLGPHAAVGV